MPQIIISQISGKCQHSQQLEHVCSYKCNLHWFIAVLQQRIQCHIHTFAKLHCVHCHVSDVTIARLKAALKLSASVYLERFNTCRKDTDETYVASASKLRGPVRLLLREQKVYNFDKLCELLVCHHIKSFLNENCLHYVLSIESTRDTSWLDMNALTETTDR